MLCLPYGENCSGKKSITIIFITLLGLVIFYMLNTFLSELMVRKPVLEFSIIQLLLTFTIIALGMAIYFIRQNHLLIEQIRYHQKIAQELCVQRDFDLLSGLKNRNAFARLAQQIEKRGDRVSVMVCDVDGLKIINDTLGHIAGDKIIQKAAEILKMAFPSSAKVFRIGGDEYLVIIEGILPDKQIDSIQNKILQLVERYNVEEPTIPLSMSIGFAVSSSDLGTFWEVAKQADFNMYQEKRACQEKVYHHLMTALTEK